jgi:hypothetical protein
MPAWTIAVSFSFVLEAGPIVQTIFVNLEWRISEDDEERRLCGNYSKNQDGLEGGNFGGKTLDLQGWMG